MKNLFIISLLAAGLTTGRLCAQQPETAGKEKMKIFTSWVGHWKGEGYMRMGPGEPKKTTVEERVESRLDGIVLIVEGLGKATEPKTGQEMVVHHAMAVLSFEPQSGQYKFRTFLKDGRSTDAWLETLAANQFRWGFDTPRGKTRYNITIDPQKRTWHETGEFSADGTTWSEFFAMTLTKAE